jgi:peptidoglycan/LPS O-acetylase OafA/YrhL
LSTFDSLLPKNPRKVGRATRILYAIVGKIGEASFGIYLTHRFFVTAFAFALTTVGIGYDNLLFCPALVFLTLLSSYWGVQVLYRLPFSAIVIGKPQKKQASPIQTSLTN